MLHSEHITVSKNTAAASPNRTSFKVNKGIIINAYLTFPAGCAGLVHVQVSLGGSPIMPVDKDAFIQGDNFVFVYPLFIEITQEPMRVDVVISNTDTVYAHTIDLQLLIVDKKFVQPVGASEGIIAALRSLFVREF